MSFWKKFFSLSVFKNIRSFRKRFFVALLAIIIAFNFICKPKDTYAFGLAELSLIVSMVLGVGGLTWDVITDVYDRSKEGSGETDDCATYFNKHITVDGDGSYVISDAGMVTINEMKKELEEGDSYIYGYLPGSKNLGVEGFRTKKARDFCVSLIQGNPGSLFYIVGGVYVNDPTYGQIPGIRVNIFPLPYGGVGKPAVMIGSPVNYYMEDWNSQFSYKTVYILDHGSNDSIYGMYYFDVDGTRHDLKEVEDVLTSFDLSDLRVEGKNICQANTYPSRRAFSQITVNYALGQVFSDYAGGIPVFSSVAAMKKGLDNCTKVEYMPGYTGGTITKNTVTQQEIEDYSTTYNYYYGDDSGGSGSGSGSGSGGGSSGNWVESIINGIGSFFDGLLTIVGKVIELLGKLVDLITKSFADLMDIVPTNFVNFLTALFPMVPEEWITAATLFITLALLGVLIRLFTK